MGVKLNYWLNFLKKSHVKTYINFFFSATFACNNFSYMKLPQHKLFCHTCPPFILFLCHFIRIRCVLRAIWQKSNKIEVNHFKRTPYQWSLSNIPETEVMFVTLHCKMLHIKIRWDLILSMKILLLFWRIRYQKVHGRDMRFPTMWYVRPAKSQTSLRLRAVWSEPLLITWIFYDC